MIDTIKGKVIEIVSKEEEYSWKLIDTIEEYDGKKLFSKTEIFFEKEWKHINMYNPPIYDNEGEILYKACFEIKIYQNVTHHSVMKVDKDVLHLFKIHTYDENNNLIHSC